MGTGSPGGPPLRAAAGEHPGPAAKMKAAPARPTATSVASKAKRLCLRGAARVRRPSETIDTLEVEQRELSARIASAGFYKESRGGDPRCPCQVRWELNTEITAAYARWDELDRRQRAWS